MEPDSKMGQATMAGVNLIKSYHRQLVQEALEKGYDVPEEVLKEYPELKNENLQDSTVS